MVWAGVPQPASLALYHGSLTSAYILWDLVNVHACAWAPCAMPGTGVGGLACDGAAGPAKARLEGGTAPVLAVSCYYWRVEKALNTCACAQALFRLFGCCTHMLACCRLPTANILGVAACMHLQMPERQPYPNGVLDRRLVSGWPFWSSVASCCPHEYYCLHP